MQDFRKLIVWHKAQALATRLDPIVDRIAKRKPALADQIERCANSICANIAEGCGRESKADKKRFFTFAIGSTTEILPCGAAFAVLSTVARLSSEDLSWELRTTVADVLRLLN